MSNFNLTIGADPEFFVVTPKGNPYPIVGLLGGDKVNPVEVPGLGAYLEDNVMAEFNIEPCTTPEQFVERNTNMIEYIMSQLPDSLSPNFFPAHRFRKKHLSTMQAQTFGCEPDFNAYTGKANQISAADAGTLRTAGGHIHIGTGTAVLSKDQKMAVARAFDLMVTIPFITEHEPENERRTLYGKAGSMRFKDYGLECRQLSCYWLSSVDLMKYVFNKTIEAYEFSLVNDDIKDPTSDLCVDIQNSINNNDTALMADLFKFVNA